MAHLWEKPRRLQVSLWAQAEGDGLQLGAEAEELAADAHDRDAGDVERPPGEGGRKLAVVAPAGEQVYQVPRAGEVQALLRPLHHVPQDGGTEITGEYAALDIPHLRGKSAAV